MTAAKPVQQLLWSLVQSYGLLWLVLVLVLPLLGCLTPSASAARQGQGGGGPVVVPLFSLDGPSASHKGASLMKK